LARSILDQRDWLAFAALGLVWGSTWVAAGSLDEQVPPILGAAARFLFSALLLIPVIVWKRLRLPPPRALAFLLLLSVTMIVLPFLLLFWGRQNVPSATVAVLFAAMPLLVVLLSPILEGGEAPRVAMQATIVGLGAIALAMGASFSVSQAAGAAVVLAAVASTGASSLVARRELRSVSPLVAAALLLGAAALLLLLASIALERGAPVQWDRNAVQSLIFLAVVGGAPAYTAYFWLLQRLQAFQVATLQWIEPLVAMIEAALFLRLRLSFSMLAGSVVTLVSVLIVMLARADDDNNVSLLGN
jgi:drug/metabolite transporter (DMT)-like permease